MAEQNGQWVTIKGRHVFIADGESVQDAINKSIARQNEEKKERDIANAKKQAEIANNKSPISKIEDATRQTLRNAYENHRLRNGLKSVPQKEISDDFFKSYYGNIDSKVASVKDSTLKDLSDKYDTALSSVRLMDKTEFLGHKNSFAFTYHDYTVDTSTLVLNSVKCGDYDKLVGRVGELVQSGYAVKIDSDNYDKYVITHEFAHTLIDMRTPLNNKTNWLGADYKKIADVRKEIGALYNSYLSELSKLESQYKSLEMDFIMGTITSEKTKQLSVLSNDISKLKLSKYSLENADEFMAEAFTMSQLGSSDNKYVKSVMNIIDKNFRR